MQKSLSMILINPAVKVEWLLIICTFNAVAGTHFLCSHLQIYTSAFASVRNLCQFFFQTGLKDQENQWCKISQRFNNISTIFKAEKALCSEDVTMLLFATPVNFFRWGMVKEPFLYILHPTFVFILKHFSLWCMLVD